MTFLYFEKPLTPDSSRARARHKFDAILYRFQTKRDTGATFGDYAQNVYESLKNALVSRITNIRRPYGDDVTTGTTDISTEQYEMGDGVKIIKTTLTESYGGAQVPEIADDAVGKLTMSDKLKIVQGLHKTIVPKTTLTDDSSDTTSSAAASNESDGGDDNESKIEIDKSLFTKYLNAAMRLQVSSTNGPCFFTSILVTHYFLHVGSNYSYKLLPFLRSS